MFWLLVLDRSPGFSFDLQECRCLVEFANSWKCGWVEQILLEVPGDKTLQQSCEFGEGWSDVFWISNIPGCCVWVRVVHRQVQCGFAPESSRQPSSDPVAGLLCQSLRVDVFRCVSICRGATQGRCCTPRYLELESGVMVDVSVSPFLCVRRHCWRLLRCTYALMHSGYLNNRAVCAVGRAKHMRFLRADPPVLYTAIDSEMERLWHVWLASP